MAVIVIARPKIIPMTAKKPIKGISKSTITTDPINRPKPSNRFITHTLS